MASIPAAPPPIKDDYLAKLAKRKALKEKNIKYWEDDALSESPDSRVLLRNNLADPHYRPLCSAGRG